MGYSPRGRKESDTTEPLHFTSLQILNIVIKIFCINIYSTFSKLCVCVASHIHCVRRCNPMDYSPPGSSVRGILPGKNTGVSCHALLQENFLTQGPNSSLPVSPALQGDSLLTEPEPPGKPFLSYIDSYFLHLYIDDDKM